MPYVVRTIEVQADHADAEFSKALSEFETSFCSEQLAAAMPDPQDADPGGGYSPEILFELVAMGEGMFRQARTSTPAMLQRTFVFRWGYKA